MFRNFGQRLGRASAAQAVFAVLIMLSACTAPELPALDLDPVQGRSYGRTGYVANAADAGTVRRRSGPFARSKSKQDGRTFSASFEGTVADVAVQVLGVELGYGVVLVGDLSLPMSWDTDADSAEDVRDAVEAAVQAAGYSISYSGNVVVVAEDGTSSPDAKAHVHLSFVRADAMARTISATFDDLRASAQGRNLVFSGSQKDVTEAVRLAVSLDVEQLSTVSWAVVDLPAKIARDAVELVDALSWSEEGKTVEVRQLADTGLVVVTGYSNGAVDEAVALLEGVAERDGGSVARTVSVRDPVAAEASARALFQEEYDLKEVFSAVDDEAGTVVLRGDPRVVGDVVQFLRSRGGRQDWVAVRAVVIETAVGSAVDRGLSLSWSDGSSRAGLVFGGSDPEEITGGFAAAFGLGNFNAALAWLQKDAKTRIVAKPSLSVRSGASGDLNVGSQVPVLETQTNSTESGDTVTQTVAYRDTGVSLTVSPKVLHDGRIAMVLTQQHSSAAENTFSTVDSPVFNQRRLSTEIAVRPGELAVIAGLEGIEGRRTHTGPKWARAFGAHSGSKTRFAIFLTASIQDGDTRSQAATAALTALGKLDVN